MSDKIKFSEREGHVPIRKVLDRKSMPDRLLNRLLNSLHPILKKLDSTTNGDSLYSVLWDDFLGQDLDKIPRIYSTYPYVTGSKIRDEIKDLCSKEWFYIYEYIEFLYDYFYKKNLVGISKIINPILEQEKSAYRMIDGQFVLLTGEQEIKSIESATRISDKYVTAKKHLQTSITLYADRENPDYANSIKESIHAIEAIAKVVVGNDTASFSTLMATLKQNYDLPESLKLALNNLYGYTSNEDGIRHAFKDGQTPPTENDARFMLVICSAFVNYIIGKIET